MTDHIQILEIKFIQIIDTEINLTIEIETIQTIGILDIRTIDHAIIPTIDQNIKFITIDHATIHRTEDQAITTDEEITPNHHIGITQVIIIHNKVLGVIHLNIKDK